MSVKLMLDAEPKLYSYKKYLIPARNSRHRTACMAPYPLALTFPLLSFMEKTHS
jgi:hypothetical protein